MYVRTKDWIYDTENLHYRRIENNKVYKVGWDVEEPTFEADIIKKSENLEELIDGYYMDKGAEFTLADLLGKDCNDVLRRNIAFLNNKKIIVKAFIKTEWELKFVAKMNDKGELALI